MAGMTGMEEGGWAAKLFSSALFCLWLSLASVTVWFDAGSGRTPMTARTPTSEDAPDRSSSRAGAPGCSPGGRATALAERFLSGIATTPNISFTW